MPIQFHTQKKLTSTSPTKLGMINEIIRSFLPNIRTLKNIRSTYSRSIIKNNKNQVKSNLYIEQKKPKEIKNISNEKIEMNKKTISSLETKLNRMAYITPSFINREKDEIDILIKNSLIKDNKARSNTDNILKKQNEIIDYFKSKIDETEKKQQSNTKISSVKM